MAVPKRKTSPSKRGMRRSADALKAPTYIEDKDSGELRRPHHIDLKTGMYRGRQVLSKKSETYTSVIDFCLAQYCLRRLRPYTIQASSSRRHHRRAARPRLRAVERDGSCLRSAFRCF